VSESGRRDGRAITAVAGITAAHVPSEIPPAFRVSVFDPGDPAFAGLFTSWCPVTVDASMLPGPMRAELSWWFASCHAAGLRQIDTHRWRSWVRIAAAAAAGPGCESFTDLDAGQWSAEWAADFCQQHGRLPAPATRRQSVFAMEHMLKALAVRAGSTEWWRNRVWDLQLDSRIPRRAHEPCGTHRARFDGFAVGWLRDGAQYFLAMRMQSGHLTWSSAIQALTLLRRLDVFLAARGVSGPALAEDTALRALAADLATSLRASPRRRDSSTARYSGASPLAPQTIVRTQEAVARFYAFMFDYQTEAAAALGDDRWLGLTSAHARLWRPEEKMRRDRSLEPADDNSYLSDTDLSRVLAHIDLLGMPRDQEMTITRAGRQVKLAGRGDPSAMRAWLLQAMTGRRASEILMMDFDPLTDVPGLDAAAVPEGGMVARLRYQQTKIDGAPATILVGADVTQIIAEQQEWVREQWNLGPREQARYLFPRQRGNLRGDQPRGVGGYLSCLRGLSLALGLHDQRGRLLPFSRSHRLRHTRATTLLNAGAPIHVVQRYLGHLSPEMTMRYAATLATTAEREFLALAKVGRDGREITMDRRDMLDALQLEGRTDRVLPNGWCLLPPARSCDKGNACHGCDHFATDRSHLDEIRRQLAGTELLIEQRQARHQARYGEPMSPGNVWLEQRLTEIRSIRLEITALEAQADETSIVRGAGVLGRTGYQDSPVPVTITAGPGTP